MTLLLGCGEKPQESLTENQDSIQNQIDELNQERLRLLESVDTLNPIILNLDSHIHYLQRKRDSLNMLDKSPL